MSSWDPEEAPATPPRPDLSGPARLVLRATWADRGIGVPLTGLLLFVPVSLVVFVAVNWVGPHLPQLVGAAAAVLVLAGISLARVRRARLDVLAGPDWVAVVRGRRCHVVRTAAVVAIHEFRWSASGAGGYSSTTLERGTRLRTGWGRWVTLPGHPLAASPALRQALAAGVAARMAGGHRVRMSAPVADLLGQPEQAAQLRRRSQVWGRWWSLALLVLVLVAGVLPGHSARHLGPHRASAAGPASASAPAGPVEVAPPAVRVGRLAFAHLPTGWDQGSVTVANTTSRAVSVTCQVSIPGGAHIRTLEQVVPPGTARLPFTLYAPRAEPGVRVDGCDTAWAG